ncbi:MAG: deoxyribose-phosphate aldolase [Erysipelotrichaceae bacterium]
MNKYIDHTLLKQNSTKQQIDTLLQEAITHQFKSVCVNPYWISYCKKALQGTGVLVCTVIGFPLGANTTATKVFEAVNAIENGAQEVDMVLNIGALIDGDYEYVTNEIKLIKEACKETCLKVIIETCLLTDEQKEMACKAVVEAKADFVKTSTGFSTSGATVSDVALMKRVVKDDCFIKAAGGVRNVQDLHDMIEAGANRIGTSSGVKLMQNEEGTTNY